MPCIPMKFRERSGKNIEFKWMKTRPEAVKPSKERVSDSGYDLTILEPVKVLVDIFSIDPLECIASKMFPVLITVIIILFFVCSRQ